MPTYNPFAEVPLAPLNDPIIKVNEAFRGDPRRDKLNLAMGVYRLESGVLPVFESVKRAEHTIIAREIKDGTGKGYPPIEGPLAYRKACAEIIFGRELSARENIATIQTVGGAGALAVAAIFARKHLARREVYLTQPCWANHPGVFELQDYKVNSLPYYDRASCKLNYAGLLQALRELAPGSLFLVQGICHNPSGVDLATAQWQELAELSKERKLLPLIDLAYQGLAHSLEEDAYPARLFAEQRIPCFIAHSFSKSLSLYGERVGSLSVVTDNVAGATAILSQLKNIVRPLYSTPPDHGAKMVAEIYASPELSALWQDELSTLRQRLGELRAAFVRALKEAGNTHDLSYISQGHGMFCLLQLTPQQVAQMAEQFAIYIIPDGRTCIPGLSLQNVTRVAQAIQSVSA